jgi:hypothetical protein
VLLLMHMLTHALALHFDKVDLFCGAQVGADWNGQDPLAFNLGGWACHPRMQVGSMVDVGVYAIAFLTALLGPVAHVSTARPTVVGPAQAPSQGCSGSGSGVEQPLLDLYCVTLVMRSGAVAQISTSFTLPSVGAKKRGLCVSGDAGTLHLSDLFNYDSALSYEPVGTEGRGPFKRGLLQPWRPPYVKLAKAHLHPHVTDWARGLQLMAASIATAPDADAGLPASGCGGLRVSEGWFTGEHPAHVVHVLSAIERLSPACSAEQASTCAGLEEGVPPLPPVTVSLRISSSFPPLPLLPAHVVPRQRLTATGRSARGGRALGKVASRLVFGTMHLGTAKDPMVLLDAVWALGINALDVAHAYGKKVHAENR